MTTPKTIPFHYAFTGTNIEFSFTDDISAEQSYLNEFMFAYNIAACTHNYNWSSIDGNILIPLLFDGTKHPIYVTMFALAAMSKNVECVKAMKCQHALFDVTTNLYCHVQMMFATNYGIQGCITLEIADKTLLNKLYWYYNGCVEELTVQCINFYNKHGSIKYNKNKLHKKCANKVRA